MKVLNTLRTIGQHFIFVVWIILVVVWTIVIVLIGFFSPLVRSSIVGQILLIIVPVLGIGLFLGGPISFVIGLVKIYRVWNWKVLKHEDFALLGLVIIAIGFLALGIVLVLPTFSHPLESSVIFTLLAAVLLTIGVGLSLTLWALKELQSNRGALFIGLTLFASGLLLIGLLLAGIAAGFSSI